MVSVALQLCGVRPVLQRAGSIITTPRPRVCISSIAISFPLIIYITSFSARATYTTTISLERTQPEECSRKAMLPSSADCEINSHTMDQTRGAFEPSRGDFDFLLTMQRICQINRNSEHWRINHGRNIQPQSMYHSLFLLLSGSSSRILTRD